MPSTFDFCIPTRSTSVPATPDRLHEIKYDGYRLGLEREGDRAPDHQRPHHSWPGRVQRQRLQLREDATRPLPAHSLPGGIDFASRVDRLLHLGKSRAFTHRAFDFWQGSLEFDFFIRIHAPKDEAYPFRNRAPRLCRTDFSYKRLTGCTDFRNGID
jgi:hypothetical protein